MNATLIVTAKDSEEEILECDFNWTQPFRPKIGDKIFTLNMPDASWLGSEYSEWAIITRVAYSPIENGDIVVRAKAADSHKIDT